MFFSIKKSILDGDINKLNKELKMNLVKYFIKNIITYFKYLVKGDQILSNKWKNRSKEDVEKYLDNVGELHRVWLINFGSR